MNLRRKRCAVGSMEDLWDETIFEDPIRYKTGEMPLNISTIMGNFTSEKAAKKALKRAKKDAKKFTKKHKKKSKKIEANKESESSNEIKIHSEVNLTQIIVLILSHLHL